MRKWTENEEMDRLQLLGDGAKEAASRRDWALRQRREEEMERQAQLVEEWNANARLVAP